MNGQMRKKTATENLRRFLTILLAAALVVSGMPVSSLAAETQVQSNAQLHSETQVQPETQLEDPAQPETPPSETETPIETPSDAENENPSKAGEGTDETAQPAEKLPGGV